MYKNSILRKIMSILVSVIILFTMMMPTISNAATDKATKVTLKTITDIENNKTKLENKYPGMYSKLLALKKANPNWTFTLYYTGLNWNTVLYNETEGYHGRSLVQGKVGTWLCSKCDEKVYDSGGWMCASKQAVAYLMDVRNYLNEEYIFQFEKLSYAPETYTIDGIEKVLNGTFMYKTNISQYYNNATYETITFAEAIMNAATKSGVSPYYLAARIRQEIGVSGSGSTSGTYSEDYKGYYNFYNIGATAGTNPIANGLNFAKNKAGDYLGPWNTPSKAIEGGAIWIAQNYIKVGQDTLYFQKYDVVSNGTSFYNHQYMQNIFAAKNEGYTTYTTYNKLGLLDNNYHFVIPLYEGMPKAVSTEPKVTKVTGLNEKIQIINDTLNVRKSPTTNSEAITKLSKYDMITRLEKFSSYANGYYWDKVKLSNGTIGYVAHYYTYITKDVKTFSLTKTKDNVMVGKNYTIGVKKTGISSIMYTSSNKKIAIVDKNGKITAKQYGTATITLKAAGQTKKFTVNVKKKPTKIQLTASKKTLKVKKTYQITVKKITPNGAYTGGITYTSSNKRIATVSKTGKVTAKKKGTAWITVKTANGKKAKMKIVVRK